MFGFKVKVMLKVTGDPALTQTQTGTCTMTLFVEPYEE